jgi:acetyl esterase/lipase
MANRMLETYLELIIYPKDHKLWCSGSLELTIRFTYAYWSALPYPAPHQRESANTACHYQRTPSKNKLTSSDTQKWYNLPQPAQEKILTVSPLAQIVRGNYCTPTFVIHGTNDDLIVLIPWQQSQRTYDTLTERGIIAGLELVQGAPHICDLSSNLKRKVGRPLWRDMSSLVSFVLQWFEEIHFLIEGGFFSKHDW